MRPSAMESLHQRHWTIQSNKPTESRRRKGQGIKKKVLFDMTGQDRAGLRSTAAEEASLSALAFSHQNWVSHLEMWLGTPWPEYFFAAHSVDTKRILLNRFYRSLYRRDFCNVWGIKCLNLMQLLFSFSKFTTWLAEFFCAFF